MTETSKLEPAPLWCSSRLALTIISFFGFVNLYALRVNMSVAMVCMTSHNDVTDAGQNCSQTNSTLLGNDSSCLHSKTAGGGGGEFDWDKTTQGQVLASFFWGYIVTQLPGGWLAGRYGGQRIFGWCMLVCALATLLTPLAARTSIAFLIVMRIVAGLGQGVVWPSMQVLWAHWAPPLERSKLSGFCYAGAQIGIVITFPISGLLCVYGFDGGWPSIFYVLGGAGVVWFAAWILLVSDSPTSHPRISDRERDYIVTSLAGHIDVSKKSTTTPWRSIFTSLPVWAIIVTHTCANWGTYTFMTNIPSYMKDVLDFDIKKTGFLSALPYIGFWAMVNVSGFTADFLRSRGLMSTTGTRKLFNSIGLLGPGIFVILTGYAASNPVAAVALLTVGVSLSGCQYGSGFIINPVDIAPRYAGIIFGISNTTGTLGGVLAPIVIGIITSDRTREQWLTVFFIAAAIYTFGALFYVVFGSGEIQSWAREGTMDTEINVIATANDVTSANTPTDKRKSESESAEL